MLGVLIYEKKAERKIYEVVCVFYGFDISNWTLTNVI
jgi:hypothetical protein